MSTISKAFAGLALAALAAAPLAAASSGAAAQRSAYAKTGYDEASQRADNHRRWRYRDRVDAGDVIAGIAIIGGIAAIASAVDKSQRGDRYDDRRHPERDYQRRFSSSDIDRAVDSCSRAVSRDVRVDSIDNVSRMGDGWQVSGRLYNGDGFTCSVGRDGRIERVDYGNGYSGAADGGYGADYRDGSAAADGQWSDDAYAQARLATPPAQPDVQADAQPDVQVGEAPAYPGGPLPGDEIDGDIGV